MSQKKAFRMWTIGKVVSKTGKRGTKPRCETKAENGESGSAVYLNIFAGFSDNVA